MKPEKPPGRGHSTDPPAGGSLGIACLPAYRVISMFSSDAFRTSCNRRSFLNQSLAGLGTFALAGLLNPRLFADAKAERWAVAIKPHHKPRINRVIWLCMAGGPSHLETFDY